jgi:hypothetical protein
MSLERACSRRCIRPAEQGWNCFRKGYGADVRITVTVCSMTARWRRNAMSTHPQRPRILPPPPPFPRSCITCRAQFLPMSLFGWPWPWPSSQFSTACTSPSPVPQHSSPSSRPSTTLPWRQPRPVFRTRAACSWLARPGRKRPCQPAHRGTAEGRCLWRAHGGRGHGGVGL